jgi:hypothetical protein
LPHFYEVSPRKRRFSHLHENRCEKIDAASQANSDDQMKRYARKASAFGHLLDGNDAAKMSQNIQEKICEKNAHPIYRLSEPYRASHSNTVKSFVIENRIVL